MRLLKLQLENFQGVKAATFHLEGQSASIYGDNATGKTTIFNAITWLLFDKSSTGAKNFTPKTKGPDGDLHYLDHAATGQFGMDDGRIVTLRKVFHENYKKKRGSASEEFDGHSVDFFIDDVPAKEKDYTTTLTGLCGGAENMKMLTMPDYFAETMSWDARRKILLDICGDVSDEEVIRSTDELKGLNAFLLMPGTTDQHYTVDEYKKIAAAQKSDINKQLQDIPGRIDEAQRAMPDINFSVDTIKKQLDKLSDERDHLTERKAAIVAGDTVATEVRAKIADTNAELAEARAAHITAAASQNEGVQSAIADVRAQLSEAKSTASDAEAEAKRRQANAERMTNRREELIKEYSAIQAETWNESEAICPTCHRELPEEAIAKMREDFNLRKSNRSMAINERGQKEASKDMIAAEEQQVETLQAKAHASKRLVGDLEQQLETLKKQLKQPEPFEATEEYAKLTARIAAYRREEADVGTAISAAVDDMNQKIQAVGEQVKQLQAQITQADQAEAQQKRVAELSTAEKKLSAQYEELEKGIYLCDLFTKTKVGMLTDRINSKFKNVRFRLFVEQQNGGVRDDCEVMIPTDSGRMVPFTFANNAARINAGLEIIDALSTHWGLTMPVFIDNAESVTHLLNLNTQVIRLVVSAVDATLRLVLDEQAGEYAA